MLCNRHLKNEQTSCSLAKNTFNKISDKGIISRLGKVLSKLNIKKRNSSIKIGQKTWTDIYQREVYGRKIWLLIFKMIQRWLNGEIPTNGIKITGHSYAKINLNLNLIPYIKINPKLIVKVKHKTIKLLEENTEEILCDLRLGKQTQHKKHDL